MKSVSALAVAAIATLALFAGCGSPETAPASTDAQNQSDHSDHADHGRDDGDALSPMEKMKVELAKLSPEDAASAEKQHTCPVSGEMLGVMGPPIKVNVEGRDVWICCEGCRQQLLDDPDAYLAKMRAS